MSILNPPWAPEFSSNSNMYGLISNVNKWFWFTRCSTGASSTLPAGGAVFTVFCFLFPSLVRTFLLVDGSVGLQKADMIALEMCEDSRRPYVVGHPYVHAIGRPRRMDEQETETVLLSSGWLVSSSPFFKYMADFFQAFSSCSAALLLLLLASPPHPATAHSVHTKLTLNSLTQLFKSCCLLSNAAVWM